MKIISLDGMKSYHEKVKELLNGKANSSHTHSNYLTGITKDMVTNALGYTPPSTDTNTWRGIQNNLTSNSTTDSLSAAQGKALKALVDGKATVETGTWTPVLTGYTHDPAGFPSVVSAMYIKIGKLVMFDCSLSRVGSNNVWWHVAGLPYASSSSKLAYDYGEGWVIGVNGTEKVCRLEPIGRGKTFVDAIGGTPIPSDGFYNVYGWYVTD